MTDEEFMTQYKSLLHAVQSGIAWTLALEHPECVDINLDPNLREHKHLRVGIDSEKSDMGALVTLLIEKGVITNEEYRSALINGMKREKALYERSLSERLKAEIRLG